MANIIILLIYWHWIVCMAFTIWNTYTETVTLLIKTILNIEKFHFNYE